MCYCIAFGLMHLHHCCWQYVREYWVIINVSDIVVLLHFLEQKNNQLFIFLAY